MPLLRDPDAAWDRPAVTTHGRNNHAVRSERWRYIRYADGSEELYDHDADPLEWANLAGSDEPRMCLARSGSCRNTSRRRTCRMRLGLRKGRGASDRPSTQTVADRERTHHETLIDSSSCPPRWSPGRCCPVATAQDTAAPSERRIDRTSSGSSARTWGRTSGCYGTPEVRTPNLDRLAREGVAIHQRLHDRAGLLGIAVGADHRHVPDDHRRPQPP